MSERVPDLIRGQKWPLTKPMFWLPKHLPEPLSPGVLAEIQGFGKVLSEPFLTRETALVKALSCSDSFGTGRISKMHFLNLAFERKKSTKTAIAKHADHL